MPFFHLISRQLKNIIELDFTDEVIINDQENSNSFMVNDLEISKLKKEFSDYKITIKNTINKLELRMKEFTEIVLKLTN